MPRRLRGLEHQALINACLRPTAIADAEERTRRTLGRRFRNLTDDCTPPAPSWPVSLPCRQPAASARATDSTPSATGPLPCSAAIPRIRTTRPYAPVTGSSPGSHPLPQALPRAQDRLRPRTSATRRTGRLRRHEIATRWPFSSFLSEAPGECDESDHKGGDSE
jgi:hypothetical protein